MPQAAARTDRWSTSARLDLIGVCWLTAATLFVGLYRADGTTSLWTDELFSVTFASKPWHVIAQQLWGENANMGLYYVLLAGWIHLWGLFGVTPTEWLIRLPSIAFAVGSVLAAYLVAVRLLGRVAGLIGATLLLVNYVFLMEVAQARAYTLELFLQLVGWLLFIRILRGPATNRWLPIAYGVVMALAVYADLFSVLIVATQLAIFGVLLRVDPGVGARAGELFRQAAAAAVTFVLAIVPISIDVVLHRIPNDWVPTPGLHELVTFAGAVSAANPVYSVLLAAGVGLALATLARQRPSASRPLEMNQRSVTVLLGTWILLPIVLSYGLSHKPFDQHLFLTRYLLPVVPAICLLVAAGLYAVGNRRLRIGLLAATLIVSLAAIPLYYARVQREDFRTATTWLVQRYRPGDGIACASLGCAFAVEYYAPGRMQAEAPGQYVWDPGQFGHVSADPSTIATYAQDHSRIFFVYGTAGQIPYIADDESWLMSHGYQRTAELITAPGSAGTVTVELFERPTTKAFMAGW